MEEFVIFERFFDQESRSDTFFIRLSCEEDIETQYIQPLRVAFAESLDSMYPMMIIDFVDGSGDFFSKTKLDTEVIFNLYYGRTIEDLERTQFKIAEIQFSNGIQGTPKSSSFKVIFLHKDWEEISAVRRNRGWVNTRYSDIVNQILQNREYDEIEIEESFRVPFNVLQSNWTDEYMIEYIKDNATPRSQDGHYEYCGRLDGRFFFMSTYELIQRGIEAYKNDDMPILRMGGQPSEQERERYYSENKQVPIGFMDFRNNEHYADFVANGITMIETGYYDWNNRRYIRTRKKFSDLNATQLSEKSLIRDNVDFLSKKLFGGRDSNIESYANNLLSGMAITMQDITINIEGTFHLHCGDIVEVVMPSNPEEDMVPYNELYSGFYMIREVNHAMGIQNQAEFVTNITLSRHGIDNKEIEGYVSSRKGRFSMT